MIIEMLQGQAILWSLLGGILPAIVWLLFWLREDGKNPEPKTLIVLAFLSGMLAVPLVLPFEMWVYNFFRYSALLTFILWAFFEETFKYIACRISVLGRRDMDEPIDAMIYLITAALGFSALENTFFLIQPFLENDILGGIITGNLRFVGASLLHIVASASVGVFIALSFNRKTRRWPISATLKGLAVAIILHTLFNLFIMKNSSVAVFTVFLFVWGAIVVLLSLFEKVKRI